MKNRERQRANRRSEEEKLHIRNNTGELDPTPYLAVLNMRNGNYCAQKQKRGERNEG